MTPRRALPVRLLLLLGAALSATGCGNGDPGGPTPGPTATGELPAGSGLALSRGDVADLPDTPLTAGTVLVIPADRTADLQADAGVDPAAPDDLRYAGFPLPADRLAALAGAAVAIGPDGRFPVPEVEGGQWVCLADIFADHLPGPPYQVVGCAPVTLTAGAALAVWHGEGGVEASPDPPPAGR